MRGRESTVVPFADPVIAVATAAIACLVGSQYSPLGWGPDPVAYALTVLIFLPLAVRRQVPVLALALSNSALLVFVGLGYPQLGMNFWGPVLAVYSVASLRPPKIVALCYSTVVPVLLWAGLRLTLPWYIAVAEAVVFPLTAWALGNVGRQLELRNRQLAVLTEQLRVEQESRTERAVTEERVRIARELHDVVAHHMSVIAVQTGLAGYVFDDDPPTARAAVNTISATSREALREMRRLLVLLRTDDEPDDTALNLAHLPELVRRMRATGLPVSMDLPADGLDELSPGLQQCAYRVVQEALTNVIKHAGLASTEITVVRGVDHLTVRVSNKPGQPVSSAGLSTGHGLVSMRERAALYHGTLVAERNADGGFVVDLTLPTGADDRPSAV
ncbi:sensor histidine kinase [Actinophytocola glycyrrhizae]|uniref:histidine kinase n=1 Tax=Actinophytocola glycyrrhizae TaxID=2044873 RepID=A0ABV9S9J4_9PSEU